MCAAIIDGVRVLVLTAVIGCVAPPELHDIWYEAPGENCSAGGTAEATGLDANFDGMLDVQESGFITFYCTINVDGDYEITTERDAAFLRDIVFISGNLTLSPTTPAVVDLSHLERVKAFVARDAWQLERLRAPQLRIAEYIEILNTPRLHELDLSQVRIADHLDVQNAAITHLELLVEDTNIRIDAPLETARFSKLRSRSAQIANSMLTSLEVPNLEDGYVSVDTAARNLIVDNANGGVWIHGPHLETLALPHAVKGEVVVTAPELSLLDVPRFEQGRVAVSGPSRLTSLLFPSLVKARDLRIERHPMLRWISAPLLTSASITITDNPQFPACEVARLAAQAHAPYFDNYGNDETAVCN